MKKIITFIILLYSVQFSFGQKTFTSRAEASTWLKETFSKCFVKTLYSTGQGTRHYYYEYLLGDNYIVIKEKCIYNEGSANEKQELKWYSTHFLYPLKLSQTTAMAQYSSFIKLTSDEIHGGDKEYINRFRYQWKAFDFYFPFDLTKEKNTIESMQIAFDYIRFYDAMKMKMYSDSMDQADKEEELRLKGIVYTSLNHFSVYTPDSVMINLHTYTESNRRFKDKPTLLVTFSNEWCRPCIMKIDSILNSGLALEYNIVLVNRDGATSLSTLKMKISKHIPDFNKDALVIFDRDNQLKPIDKNAAPYFIWLNKKMEIKSTFSGYNLSILEIIKQLKEIE